MPSEEIRLFRCSAEGNKLRTEPDAVDLISESHGADMIVIPVERLDEDFFALRTCVAGEFLQKFVNYGRRVAIVGDITRHVENSSALRDFVMESNRGEHIWFAANQEEVERRLAAARELGSEVK